MGPRLISRGNIQTSPEYCNVSLASMGPRLISRGNFLIMLGRVCMT